jgi:hypothetical protein
VSSIASIVTVSEAGVIRNGAERGCGKAAATRS